MSHELPQVSVIIPAPPGMNTVQSADAAQHLGYPSEKLEVIVVRGRHPSVQRNTALRAARGELIYFLDDDVVPDTGNLLRMAECFEDKRVAMLGGPNLCPADAPALEQLFALVLSAWLGFGPSRARYARVGQRRPASEKELILCNLAARRDEVLAQGGFDEALYPNEENKLMDQLQASGLRLVYDPDFIAHRRPRRNLRSFARMLVTYGRGRAEQFRLHPTWGSALNFVPPLFCVYLVLLPLGIWWPWLFWPLAFYAVAVAIQTLALVRTGGVRALATPPLVVLTHVLYGLGFWRGLFRAMNRAGDAGALTVHLERIQP